MVRKVEKISGSRCSVCGQPATDDWQKYMAPRCAAHAHNLLGLTGRVAKAPEPPAQRRAFWRFGEHERKPVMSHAFQADYGDLELRVLAHSMEQLAGNIAYELSRTTVMDMPTARALVDATVRALVNQGPAQKEELRQQKHTGYMVCSDGRYMYWPVEDLQEARTYCEDNVEPVKLMADVAELNKHEEGQA